MNSISQPIVLSMPVKKKQKGKSAYKDPFKDVDSSYHFYSDFWSGLLEKFKRINESLSKKFITDITKFIQSYEHPSSMIPTLGLLTGVNVSDHEILFQRIKQEIKSIRKCHVVFIQSRHDTSVKPVIERMVRSFLTNHEIESENCENDDDRDDDEVLKKLKKSICTLPRLKLWYKNQRNNEDDVKPLIIVVPDVESFSSKVLNDFFSILSVYKNQLPFIIILGIATDLNALHQRVSPPVLQDFNLTIFKSQPSLKFLDLVLEEIFLTAGCPFLLHGKVLELLIEMFTFYNFSVEFFIRGIQFCVMNHFWSSDCNILCCPIDQIPKVVKSLSKEQFNTLLHLPSVCNYNEERRNEKLPQLTTKNIKSELVSLMNALHNRISRFHLGVRCFYAVAKLVLTSDFKTLRGIYCDAMQTNITKTEEFKHCMLRVKVASIECILKSINAIEELLRPQRDDEKIQKYLETLTYFRRSSETLDAKDNAKSCSPKKRAGSPSEMNAIAIKSPRKILFDAEKSSHKRNTISSESPKKEQMDPEKSCLEMQEKMIEEEEPVTPKKVLSSRNDPCDIQRSPVKMTLRRKELLTPTKEVVSSEKLNGSLDSNDPKTTSSTRKSSRNLPCTTSTKSCPTDQLLASVCNQIITPKTQGNFENRLGSRSEFKKALLMSARQPKRSASARDQWKHGVVEFFINSFFKEMLECPNKYTLHEILMYEEWEYVKKNFTSVNQRGSIEKALQNPQTILKCKCCKMMTSEPLGTFPDICITYKVIFGERDSSDDINLKTILDTFNYLVAGEEVEEISPEVYNRFQQTIRDLLLMGFIKPHKSKADFIKLVSLGMK